MPRLRHAKALLIDTKGNTYETVTLMRSLRRTVTRLLRASSSLSGLHVLVSHTLMTRARHCTLGVKDAVTSCQTHEEKRPACACALHLCLMCVQRK